jgi:hypothetical protein
MSSTPSRPEFQGLLRLGGRVILDAFLLMAEHDESVPTAIITE